MSELSPFRSRLGADARVRLRCNDCEVAWSGPKQSDCWVCGAEGAALHPGLASRDATVSAFDLELLA